MDTPNSCSRSHLKVCSLQKNLAMMLLRLLLLHVVLPGLTSLTSCLTCGTGSHLLQVSYDRRGSGSSSTLEATSSLFVAVAAEIALPQHFPVAAQQAPAIADLAAALNLSSAPLCLPTDYCLPLLPQSAPLLCCDPTTAEVTHINMNPASVSSVNITLPSSIATLSSLIQLAVDQDLVLVGQFPSAISSLLNLQTLKLLPSPAYLTSDVHLFSLISSLSKLSVLEVINMPIVGSLPPDLGLLLPSLQHLLLVGATLTGPIPDSISGLTLLSHLSLYQTNGLKDDFGLSGTIPQGLSCLTRLTTLQIPIASLTGSIPESLSALTNLQILDFSYNQLSGSLPNSLSTLLSLQYFDVHHNQLSGSIPAAIAALPSLTYLDVSETNVSGKSFGRAKFQSSSMVTS